MRFSVRHYHCDAILTNCMHAFRELNISCCRLKWFHVYRIRLIVNHDEHVGRHLHVPNASGKYNTVSCRQALDLVFNLLYRHSSFVLIDKHAYVTLLYRCVILGTCCMIVSVNVKNIDRRHRMSRVRIEGAGGRRNVRPCCMQQRTVQFSDVP